VKVFKTLAVLIALGGIVVWCVTLSHYATVAQKGTMAQRSIVDDVKGLIENCRNAGDKVTIVGKALVWDMENDSPSGAHHMLSVSLKAKSTDKSITVFMVIRRTKEGVGTYSISGQLAYRQYTDIAVAYWPEKKPAGFHSVGAEPPSRRSVRDTPEYGNPDVPIARWIESLPRSNQ
jgi:hypothetical protein